MADIETQGQTVRRQTIISSVFSCFHRHLGLICDNLYHLNMRGSTQEPGMWSKMAASEARHERFVSDGPKTKKNKTHVHISTHGEREREREALSELGSAVCVFRESEELGCEHRRTSNPNTYTLVWEWEHGADIERTAKAHTKYSIRAKVEPTHTQLTCTQNNTNTQANGVSTWIHCNLLLIKKYTPLNWHAFYIPIDLNVYTASIPLNTRTHARTVLPRLSCNSIGISAYAARTSGTVSALSSFYLQHTTPHHTHTHTASCMCATRPLTAHSLLTLATGYTDTFKTHTLVWEYAFHSLHIHKKHIYMAAQTHTHQSLPTSIRLSLVTHSHLSAFCHSHILSFTL